MSEAESPAVPVSPSSGVGDGAQPSASPGGAAQRACTGVDHPLLSEVDGVFGWYRCAPQYGGCGDYFDLQAMTPLRHTPSDLARMLHYLTLALAGTEGEAVLAALQQAEGNAK